MPYYMKTLLLLTFSALTTLTFGQTVSVANVRNNILYVGIDNQLDAVVENIKCGTFFLTTDNGKISGENCNFTILPDRVGRATIFLKKVNKKDTITIATREFRVKAIPNPIAKIAGKNFGTISALELSAQIGIITVFENLDIDIKIPVTNYSVLILRDNTPIFTKNLTGNKLTEDLKKEFLKLEPDDQVLFYNILATRPTGTIERLEPIDLKINK